MRNAEKWGLALPLWQKRSKVDAYWSKWCKRQHAEGANKHVMDASVLLSPSTHVNAVSASSPKVTCVSLGLSSRLRAPSLACRPSEQPCRPQLTVRTASSSDREEARPAAMKRQDGWRQTEGWRSRKVREKKKKKASVQPRSITIQSVSRTKPHADIIRQDQGALDEKNTPRCHTRPMIFPVAKTNSCDIRGLLTGWNWTVKQCATPWNRCLSHTSTSHIMTPHQSEIQPPCSHSKCT